MAKDPAFPWYASDWLGSNRRATMSLEQQGAYMVLLCRQWSDKTCSLPDDDEALARLSELNEGWFTGGSQVLRPCFPKHPNTEGRVANPKLLKVREERDEWIEKSREGGRKSGATRRAKAKQPKTCDNRRVVEPPHEPNANQTRTKCEPNANSPSPSPSPSLLKKPPLNPPSPKQAFDPLTIELPFDSPDFVQAWADFCKHRQNVKIPLTELASTRILNKCRKWGEPTAILAIDATIASDKWTDIYKPRGSVGQPKGTQDDDRPQQPI